MPAKTSVASATSTSHTALTVLPRALSSAANAGRIGAAALIVLVAQSIWWDDVPLTLQLACTGLAVFSFFRPAEGLLVVAGLSPLGVVVSRQLNGGHVRFSEAMVLAFLAGWLVRTTRPGPARGEIPPRLVLPVAVFGAVVLASTIEQLFVYQVWQDFPWPYVQGFWFFLTQHYFTDVTGYWHVPVAALLLEGLGLFLAASIIARHDSTHALRSMRMLVLGAIGAASLSLLRLAMAILRSGDQLGPFEDYFGDASRNTMFIGDINAAASYFLLALGIVLGLAQSGKSMKRVWFGTAVLLTLAIWVTGSLSAIGLALLVWLAAAIWIASHRYSRQTTVRVAVLGTVSIAVAVFLIFEYAQFQPPGSYDWLAALRYRGLFLDTSLRMWASAPLFGVGIGQYFLQSSAFGSPELLAIHPRENAHNYFLQVSAELGTVGGLSFLLIVGMSLWVVAQTLRTKPLDSLRGGTFVGLAMYLLTCLTGHPLLVPEVAFALWTSLGIAVGSSGARLIRRSDAMSNLQHAPNGGVAFSTFIHRSASRWRLSVVTFLILLIGVSLPFRVEQAVGEIDLLRIEYGFHEWETEQDGTRFRWMKKRARFFVPGDVAALSIPVRALYVDSSAPPVTAELLLDGRLADRVRLEDGVWREMTLRLPTRAHEQFRQVDLVLPYSWRPADVIPGSLDTRELGVKVGEIILR